MAFYRYNVAEKLIIEYHNLHNTKISDIYKEEIYSKYKQILLPSNKISTKNYEKKFHFIEDTIKFFNSNNLRFRIFNKKTAEIINNSDVINLDPIFIKQNFFTNFIEKIFVITDKFFFKSLLKKVEIKDSLNGDNLFRLIKTESNKGKNYSLVSYIPIIGDDKQVEIIVLLYNDITKEWNNIYLLQINIIFLSFFISLLYLSLLIFYLYKAKIEISKQVENNITLKKENNNITKEGSANTAFFANFSHELRTPLNSIIGFSDLILEDKENKITPKYIEYIKDINDSGKHLLSIINDILDFVKSKSNEINFTFTKVKICRLISQCLHNVSAKATENKITLVEELPTEEIIIKIDNKRLKQILLNLLSNAIKFSCPGEKIKIKLTNKKEQNTVQIDVIDEGIGIQEKDIPKILAGFNQVDNEANKVFDGTGLGLALSKRLTEAMGGKFIIKSIYQEGTTISLIFKI